MFNKLFTQEGCLLVFIGIVVLVCIVLLIK